MALLTSLERPNLRLRAMLEGKAVLCLVVVLLVGAFCGCAPQQKTQVQQSPQPQAQPEQQAHAEQAVAIPAELQARVREAELWGRALFDSYTSEQPATDAAVRTALETVAKSVKDHCAAAYRAVVVRPSFAPNDRIIVYDMGEVPPSQGILVGRHYRVETTLDGKGVLLGEPSMTSCLTLPPTTDASAGIMVTHLLSTTPNEFHVFLSLFHRRSLHIATDSGVWTVDAGKISFMGRS
jgi:hypothetical protein